LTVNCEEFLIKFLRTKTGLKQKTSIRKLKKKKNHDKKRRKKEKMKERKKGIPLKMEIGMK
jgi:hypothetical protein